MARTLGAKNKIGETVKSNLIGVFDKIGGREKMAQWAQENLTEFYRLYARLIPSEVTTTIDIRDARELTDSQLAYIASGGSAGTDGAQTGEPISGEVH